MQIYDITVRFARTIQVREYEPASAEVTIKAQIAEGEDATPAVTDGFRLISEQVHLALGLEANTKLPTRTRGGKAAVTAEATAAPKAETTKVAAPKAETKKADAPKPTPAASDIPDDGAPADKTTAPAAQVGEAISAAELSKWIGDQVRLGKVTSQAVMGLYPKFGVSRFADLKPEKCAEAKAAIEEIINGATL